MKILVIGATGQVGRQVVAQLSTTGVPFRALARNPHGADLPQCEVVSGDLTLPHTLDESLDGIDTVFLVWCAAPAAVTPALERILKDVRRIVFLSSPHQTPHPFFQGAQPNPMARMQADIEHFIQTSGRQWTFLRPGMFAVNTVHWWAARIRAGNDVLRWPYANVPTAPIDERDIAAVAVRALTEEGHAGAEYLLTGPHSLTQSEQLATIGAVIGRPLRMEEISPEEARRELADRIPPPVVNMLLLAWGAAAGRPALVSSTVGQVTGTPARTFHDWATDHAAVFRPVDILEAHPASSTVW